MDNRNHGSVRSNRTPRGSPMEDPNRFTPANSRNNVSRNVNSHYGNSGSKRSSSTTRVPSNNPSRFGPSSRNNNSATGLSNSNPQQKNYYSSSSLGNHATNHTPNHQSPFRLPVSSSDIGNAPGALPPGVLPGSYYPPTLRGEVSAAMVANVGEDEVPLPRSEPIPVEHEESAAAWVSVFGRELVACLFSRDWAVRETGLRRLAHEVC